MAKNYFDRYVWLIDTINRHGHISKKDIDELWYHSPLNEKRDKELPERTFHNHRQAIEETFGIEIKCDRSLGYYIANSEDLEGDGVRQWLLESLSLSNLLNETNDMRERILFEEIPSSQQWIPLLVNSMRDRKAVEMTYKSYWRGEESTFIAHPYCIKLFKQRWYVLARSEEYDEPRIYALDQRMIYIKETKKALKVPARFNAREFFSNFYGVWVGKEYETMKVRLKVDSYQVNYFESVPLHHSQRTVERTDDYTVYEYWIAPAMDFRQEILRQGPTIEVLEPESLRAEVIEDLKQTLALYGND